MSKRKPARTIKARSASKIRSKAAGSGQPKGRANSKQARVLALLCGPSGATIATVTRSTGWQPHTVRAFLAAVVRKKLGLRLESEKTDGELRPACARHSENCYSGPRCSIMRGHRLSCVECGWMLIRCLGVAGFAPRIERLADDQNMIEALTPKRSDQALR